jgi:uncharacterized membrane protein
MTQLIKRLPPRPMLTVEKLDQQGVKRQEMGERCQKFFDVLYPQMNKLQLSKVKSNLVKLLLGIAVIIYLSLSSQYKFYWHDEASNFLLISGHSQQELVKSLYDGQVKTQEDIQPFQGVNTENGLDKTLTVVAKTASHQPPLYFILLWIWAKIWGNSELTFRSLSVIIWGLFIVFTYYLTHTLFNDKKISILATGLTILSPRFLGYSLDVWEYGLFSLTIVLSSYLLLKSLTFQTSIKLWVAYSLSLIAGLYTHIFFVFLILAQIIYFFLHRVTYLPLQRKYFKLSILTSIVFFIPWLTIIIITRQPIYWWARGRWTFEVFINKVLRDFVGSLGGFRFSLIAYYSSIIILGIIILISIIILVKKASNYASSFLILMITVPFVSLVIIDIIGRSKYSHVGRFYLPTYLGIIITLSFAIITIMNQVNYQKYLGYCLLILMIGLALKSQLLGLSQTQYTGYGSQIMNGTFIINQSEKPLIIGEQCLDLIPLSYTLNPKSEYLFVKDNINLPSLESYSDIYVVSPSPKLKQVLASKEINFKTIP